MIRKSFSFKRVGVFIQIIFYLPVNVGDFTLFYNLRTGLLFIFHQHLALKY